MSARARSKCSPRSSRATSWTTWPTCSRRRPSRRASRSARPSRPLCPTAARRRGAPAQVITNLASNAARASPRKAASPSRFARPASSRTARAAAHRSAGHRHDAVRREPRGARRTSATSEARSITCPAAPGSPAISRRLVELQRAARSWSAARARRQRDLGRSAARTRRRMAPKPSQAPELRSRCASSTCACSSPRTTRSTRRSPCACCSSWGITATVVPDLLRGRSGRERAVRPRAHGRAHAAPERIRRDERDPPQRSGGTGRRIPVIAMTAHGLAQERERCFEAGMDGSSRNRSRRAEL